MKPERAGLRLAVVGVKRLGRDERRGRGKGGEGRGRRERRDKGCRMRNNVILTESRSSSISLLTGNPPRSPTTPNIILQVVR